MPPRGHKSLTITDETNELLESLRDQIPFDISRGQVVHLALLELAKLDNPLDAARPKTKTKKKKD